MKKMIALALAVALLTVMMIPQVQAVEWKRYEDPQGRYSIDYPADWITNYEPIDGSTMLYDTDFDIGCGIHCHKLDVPCVPPDCIPGIDRDNLVVDEDGTGRVVIFYGTGYWGSFTFGTQYSSFDSANRMYFEHMIRSIKMK
jgi:hypothetical protein